MRHCMVSYYDILDYVMWHVIFMYSLGPNVGILHIFIYLEPWGLGSITFSHQITKSAEEVPVGRGAREAWSRAGSIAQCALRTT